MNKGKREEKFSFDNEEAEPGKCYDETKTKQRKAHLAEIIVGPACQRVERHQVVEIAHLSLQPLLLHLVLVHEALRGHAGDLLEGRRGSGAHQRPGELVTLSGVVLGVPEVHEEVAVLAFLEEHFKGTVAQAEAAQVNARH